MLIPSRILSRLILMTGLLIAPLAPLSSPAQTVPQIVQNINISFNGADAERQISYQQSFWSASDAYLQHLPGSTRARGARYCHTYVSFDVADDATGSSAEGGLKWLVDWLRTENGHCDEALITFKWNEAISNNRSNSTRGNSEPPKPEQFKVEMQHFLSKAAGWKASGLFKGNIAYTAWNEPNNPAKSGSGFGGQAIPAKLAADYYLELRTVCGNDCTVAAGDFGSNGQMWHDFVQRCDNDEASNLCSNASYLDTYKHAIDADSATIGPAPNHRPEVWAYHAWDDVNNFVNGKNRCTTPTNYDTCTTQAFVHALQGTWGKSIIWDTEVGSGQPGITSPPDAVQAQGAAFLLVLTAIQGPRIQRIYYTKAFYPSADRGNQWGSLFYPNGNPRPAYCVLTKRQIMYPSGACK